MTRFRPLLWIAGFLLLVGGDWSSGNDRYVKGESGMVPSGRGTEITAVLDTRLSEAGKNVLWCGTFQLAWNAAEEAVGFPIRLTPPVSLADSLNKRAFERRWIDERSIFIAGGPAEQSFIDSIRAGVRAKSGQEPKLLKEIDPSRDNLVFYAMLHKELHFEKPFARLGSWPINGRKISAFGFKPDQSERIPLLKQVRVHQYTDESHFLIELRTTESGDQLLLAKLPPQSQLSGAVSSTLKQLRADAAPANEVDLLVVPFITLDEHRQFAELEGHRVRGQPDLRVEKALQTIDFRMNEKGVKLHSEAELTFSCAVNKPIEPRLIVVCPPFLLLMKRKEAPMPYFVAWIANTDLLRGE